MKKILLLLFLIECTNAETVVNPLSECGGCHTTERKSASSRLPSGFGKWKDFQCYGCHEELVEVAKIHLKGLKDKRYESLPLSDVRIENIDYNPLPYIDAPIRPWEKYGKKRVDSYTLNRFLKRPHGKCFSEGACSAPRMTAYPDPYEHLISRDIEPPKFTDDDIHAGKRIFESKCKVCHKFSDVSNYDEVALSLFSRKWIYSYVNKLEMYGSERKMPKIPLTKNQSEKLYAFFQKNRSRREKEVDELVPVVMKNFINQNKYLSNKQITYIWSNFWRDGDCVHCHSIGGRAEKVFDTSLSGITNWLRDNDPMVLIERLLLRHIEKKIGMGAGKPGMPMTGDPLSLESITLLNTWIDLECPDMKQKKYCKAKELPSSDR